MRAIKFRAWDKDIEKWIWPTAIKDDGTFIQPGTWIKSEKNIIIVQFTGLQDRHGVDIYEGDIVRYDTVLVPKGEDPHVTQIIKWDNDNHKYVGLFRNGEIIGNIHEHPGLLKEA